jgi:hypothetical protein
MSGRDEAGRGATRKAGIGRALPTGWSGRDEVGRGPPGPRLVPGPAPRSQLYSVSHDSSMGRSGRRRGDLGATGRCAHRRASCPVFNTTGGWLAGRRFVVRGAFTVDAQCVTPGATVALLQSGGYMRLIISHGRRLGRYKTTLQQRRIVRLCFAMPIITGAQIMKGSALTFRDNVTVHGSEISACPP